jgi:hypothetical protein
MASTYVNDLRLNEMATGDASGSWGTVTNTNLELIGEAFSYGTETIGDADSTLTIADGAADAARSFYLKITSSVDLTTTRIVTLGPNTVSKVWMIENATTGSQVITIKQGSGATINVPNGQVKMISTDGAGSGGAVLDLLVDVDLTGTTTLVNLDVSGTALVTGVLTTTAATVSNGGGQFNGAINVGVDDTGYDVKFFGATTGKSLLWDESADSLIVTGTTTLVGTTNLDAVDIDGATQIDATVTVGVDDTGYDVKFFGATAGAYMLWDESADTLEVSGTVTADGLTVDVAGTADIVFQRDNAVSGKLELDFASAFANFNSVNDGLTFSQNAVKALQIRGGDITFYAADGTTPSFVYDESAGLTINEAGADRDFRVESDGNANMLFVDGGANKVGMGVIPETVLSVKGGGSNGFTSGTVPPGITLFGQDTDGYGTALTFKPNEGGQGIAAIGSFRSSTYHTDLRFYTNNVASGNAFSEKMSLSGSGALVTNPLAGGHAVFNEGGVDADFRVETSGSSHALFVEGDGTGVGINTSDPQEALHVTGSVRLDGNNNGITSGEAVNQLIFKDTDTTTGGGQTMGQIDFVTADADAPGVSARISGVADSSTTGQGRLTLFTGAEGTLSNNITMAAGSVVINEVGADMDFRVESDSNANALFVQASDGKVGIGTSSPETNNAASVGLTVGSGGGGAAIQLNVNGGGGIFSGTDTINNPNYSYRMGHLNGTNRLEMSTNNNDSYANGVVLSAGGTSWGTFSDERRKTDLVEITDGLNKVSTLRAVTGRYNYDDANVRRSMLIAQDVQAVLPEAVGAMTASMEDPTEYLTLNYTETIPLLVSALKDAKQLIEALTARITALENA